MTRERIQTVVMTMCSALLAVLLAFLIPFGRRTADRSSGEAPGAAERMRAALHEENRESLMRLSAVGRLSVQEQSRFDRAGDDPEHMRQALIEIHEERLTNASMDLKDARERKSRLQSSGGYKVYAHQRQAQDLVELVNEDEWAATSQIAQYADGLSRIRAWTPVSQARDAGSKPAGADLPRDEVARGSQLRRKPNPRVPIKAEPVLAGQRQTVAGRQGNFPAEPDVAIAAGSPSVTVYGNDEPASRRVSDGADAGAREQAEEEIQRTLGRWSSAVVLNDPRAEAAEYAPHLSRYFLRKNVDKAFVEADKADYLRRGNLTAAFALQGVTIENETENTADVRLVKDVTWKRRTKGEMHQLIRSRLHLERFSDGWKISGEQDFW